MAPTPPPFARARSVSSRIRFFSSALNKRRCGLARTSDSGELAPQGTAILLSFTTILLAALLCNYGRGKWLIDIGTEGNAENAGHLGLIAATCSLRTTTEVTLLRRPRRGGT